MVEQLLNRPVTVFGKKMPLKRFLFYIFLVSIAYFIFFEVSERHWCLLIDHKYGYSIEFPANRSVQTFGSLGNHNLVDEKAVFAPRTLQFLITNSTSIYWSEERKDSIEEMQSWGAAQFNDNWRPTSGLRRVLVGQDYYESWTATFRRDGWRRRQYYVPSENGTFLIEFIEWGEQNHLNSIKNHMVASFIIDDEYINEGDSFQNRTIDCIR